VAADASTVDPRRMAKARVHSVSWKRAAAPERAAATRRPASREEGARFFFTKAVVSRIGAQPPLPVVPLKNMPAQQPFTASQAVVVLP